MKDGKKRLKVVLGICAAVVAAGLLAGYFVIVKSPHLGAQAADFLRPVIGASGVAKLEEAVFTAQDNFTQFKYQLGIEKPQAPWQVTLEPVALATEIPAPTPVPFTPTPTASVGHDTSLAAVPTLFPTLIPTVTPTPQPTPWQPKAPVASGVLPGEGVWSTYLKDSEGRVVAYRTFFQPDPKRPTTIVAVVAFDLVNTRLHFVLGTNEPGLKGGPRGSGKIEPEYMKPGVILAAFSGGFQTVHGRFGAMSDRIVAVPPRDGLATVAIYEDGKVEMGEWGKNIQPSDKIIAWRQNCVPVVLDGKITDKVYNDKIADWGGTLDGQIVTMRSGMGLSADGNTLYYFAGPGMGVPALANAMIQVGVQNGMQMEINNFWTHFITIYPDGTNKDGTDKWKVDPLLPDKMDDQPARFLKDYTRDFFYVTAANVNKR